MKNPEAEVAVNSSAKESRHVTETTTATHPNPNSAKKIFVLLSSKKNLKQIIDHIYEQIESKS